MRFAPQHPRCSRCGEDAPDAVGWLVCTLCDQPFHRACVSAALSPNDFIGGRVSRCMRCADKALAGLGQLPEAALRDARELHARGLLLEARARTRGTQDNHASRLERLARFGAERLGLSRARMLPLRGPMDLHVLALFLVDLQAAVKGGTFQHYVSTLNVWHRERGLPLPSEAPEIRAKLEGIKRAIGAAGGNVQSRKAPLSLPLLHLSLKLLRQRGDTAPAESVERFRALRDQVALQLGFFGLLRKSELAAAKAGDLEEHEDRWTLRLPWSKVDQRRRGWLQMYAKRMRCGDDLHRCLRSYVRGLRRLGWAAGDPLLPAVRGGTVTRAHMPGGGAEVARLVKTCVEDVAAYAAERGIRVPLNARDYASHSLRRGGLNHALRCGITREEAMVFGRWASNAIDAYREWDDALKLRFTAQM